MTRTKTVHLTSKILKEVREEVIRQDRSASWLVRKAWLISKETIKQYPTALK